MPLPAVSLAVACETSAVVVAAAAAVAAAAVGGYSGVCNHHPEVAVVGGADAEFDLHYKSQSGLEEMHQAVILEADQPLVSHVQAVAVAGHRAVNNKTESLGLAEQQQVAQIELDLH